MEQTRRDFLKFAALVSGAAGVSGFLPESIRRAVAIEPEPGSTYVDAEHIVILMQENRSFDHALGTLQGVRGFNDPRAIRHANGDSIFVQRDKAGHTFAPWRLDIKDTKITWMGSIPHSRESQVDAWNEGLYDGWIDAKRSHNPEYTAVPITMGHYTREDLPFYYELADAFTVCDQSYCGVMTSTTPNRCTFWTGTIRDRQSPDSRVHIRNEEIDVGGMPWKTYPERLSEAGIPWKYYQNDLWYAGGFTGEQRSWLSNFGLNVLEFFAAYNVQAYPGTVLYMQEQVKARAMQMEEDKQALANQTDPREQRHLRARIGNSQKVIDRFQKYLADSGPALYQKLDPAQRTLFDSAFITNAGDPGYRSLEPLPFQEAGQQQSMNVPKGDILYQFRKDVEEGKLPTISWLGAPENFSDHPVSPWYGAWYVSEVMNILTKNPEVWKKTIFILTYDENDGYFDHSPSFVAADPKRPSTGGASEGIDTGLEYTYVPDELAMGVSEKEARSGPIGLGFRIPTIIASPWSRGGWVNSQLFDHTSTIKFLESWVQQKYGKTVHETNISAWRRAVTGDLTSSFRPYTGKEPKLDYLNRDKFVIGIRKARDKEVPSNYKDLTPDEVADINTNLHHSPYTAHQEPGIRPACALPYELYADGGLTADGSRFELRLTAANKLHGSRSAGAPFNVYLRNLKKDGMTAATYAVKPGDTLTPSFPISHFRDGQYEIDVLAPNGFYRSFTGHAKEVPIEVRTAYELHGGRPTGNVQVHLRNPGSHPIEVEVRDNSYKQPSVTRSIAASAEKSVVIDLASSHGWYDITVKAAGSEAGSRFAGRVETDRSSFTDPLMGGVV